MNHHTNVSMDFPHNTFGGLLALLGEGKERTGLIQLAD